MNVLSFNLKQVEVQGTSCPKIQSYIMYLTRYKLSHIVCSLIPRLGCIAYAFYDDVQDSQCSLLDEAT